MLMDFLLAEQREIFLSWAITGRRSGSRTEIDQAIHRGLERRRIPGGMRQRSDPHDYSRQREKHLAPDS
jgi:hypothetical protein